MSSYELVIRIIQSCIERGLILKLNVFSPNIQIMTNASITIARTAEPAITLTRRMVATADTASLAPDVKPVSQLICSS